MNKALLKSKQKQLKAIDTTGLTWLGIESHENFLKFKAEHIKFLEAYVELGEQTAAYRISHPHAKKNADVNAYQLVANNPHIQQAMMNVRARKVAGIDVSWVVDKHKKTYEDNYGKKERVRTFRVNALGKKEEEMVTEDKEVLLTPYALDALNSLTKIVMKEGQININNNIAIPILIDTRLNANNN